MVTIASRASRPRIAASRLSDRIGVGRVPLWAAVVCSRLIALAAGSAGALFTSRATDWALFDPLRISSSLGHVGNVLAASTDRWDAIHYLTIARSGYTSAYNTSFFPLYPMLIREVAWVIPNDVLAGVLISVVSFGIALVLLYKLARIELGEHAAGATIVLLAFAPMAFFFTAVYTESLFLALSVGAFYLARQQRFALASLLAAGAALTHVEGVLLTAPIALLYWQSLERPARLRRAVSVSALPLALPAVALAGLLAYFRSLGYGWMAPFSNEASYSHSFAIPPVTIVRAITAGMSGLWQTLDGTRPIAPWIGGPFPLGFQNLVYLVVLGICVATLIGAWRLLPKAYAIYAALVMVVCTSSPVLGDPLHGIDRYALVVFPLWMAAGAWAAKRGVTKNVALLSAALMCFYAFEFGAWVFVA